MNKQIGLLKFMGDQLLHEFRQNINIVV